MANLSRLLEQRNVIRRRGVELGKSGNVFYHTFTDTEGGRCQFCWNSPGTGCAVVEIWGSAGGGGRMCCCSQSGIPGNSPGYSKKLVRVCGSSYICGWAGCSTQANTLCCGGRGNCSVACIFNSGDNGCVRSEAGFGGWTNCTTSTPQWCCLACTFCSTNTGAGCGLICNIAGPNGAVQAPASAGDTNIPGGISCTMFCCCLNCGCSSAPYQTMAISAGIFSATAPTCVAFSRNMLVASQCQASNGWGELNVALSSLQGVVPIAFRCWQSFSPCGCYEFMGCIYNTPGVPGASGWPCGGVRSAGMRGGHGAVRITFYS
jgi:hypothetical protein